MVSRYDFFSLHYPRLMATGTGDWLPKMLLKAACSWDRGYLFSVSLGLLAARFLRESKSKRGARVIKSESINGTSQGIINNPVSSGRRPFRNLQRRRYRRKEEQSNIQNEGNRVSREGSSRCRIKNFRHPTRLHYAAGSTLSMFLVPLRH